MIQTHVPTLLSLRRGLYAALFACGVVTFIVSCVMVSESSRAYPQHSEAGVELITASTCILVFLAPIHYFYHLKSTPSVLGRLSVEVSILTVLWFAFVGGAAVVTQSNWYTAHRCFVASCHMLVATRAFAWITWIVITVLLGVDLAYSFLSTKNKVWSEKASIDAEEDDVTPIANPQQTEKTPSAISVPVTTV